VHVIVTGVWTSYPVVSYSRFKARSQNCEKRLLPFSCLSVRMEHLGSHWLDFHEIWYFRIFQKISRKSNVHQNATRRRGTVHEDKYIYLL